MIALLRSEGRFLDAIEADLVAIGWTWDDVPSRLPWRAFFAWLSHLGPGSATWAAVNPDAAGWETGLTHSMLMTEIGHRLDVLAWQPTKDAQKGRKFPKKWQTPWAAPDESRQKIGSDPIPASEWDAWWNSAAHQSE